jgi:hypothetical protein
MTRKRSIAGRQQRYWHAGLLDKAQQQHAAISQPHKS